VTFLESLSTPGKVKLLLIFFGISIFLFLCTAFGLVHVYVKNNADSRVGRMLADPNYTSESKERGQYTRV
jgi:hypothetical protein